MILSYQAARATFPTGYEYPDCDKKGFCYAQQNGFWSYLGLAKSTDDGKSWRDLGLIISANKPYDAHLTFDIGNGSLVVGPSQSNDKQDHSDKYLYTYFPDLMQSETNSSGTPTSMSVARVSYNELLKAVVTDRPLPPFQKYYHGEWSQPGLGGLSSDVLRERTENHIDPYVVWSDYVHRFVGIFYGSGIFDYAESADGINWSTMTVLPTTINPNEDTANYATPVGLGNDPTILDDKFYVYYNFQDFYGGGWSTVKLRRLDVSCEGLGTKN